MASVIIQHLVKDYAEWKKVFDSALDFRTAGGELSAKVYRDASEPNKITTLNTWDSMAKAQKFVHSPELIDAMEKAGVVGKPTISFLDEA